jgi:glycine/D-amino acid oxidase-like deaminating enzyme
MPQPDFDTLILGQGLAGSALAWHLIQAGQRVGMIDDGHRTSSSRVAAGLINPLAGMRFNRRPELDDWLADAARWYRSLAAVCDQDVYHPLPMLRLFRSHEQQRFHRRRREDPATRDLLDERFPAEACPDAVRAPHGGFIQHRTGYVDMPLLLGRLRRWLHERAALIEANADPGRLTMGPGYIEIGGARAARLVFCEGARMQANPWFRHLPLAPDKGEILDLHSDDWSPRHIINGAYWLLPLPGGRIRLGATHDHQDLELTISAGARDELLAGLRQMAPTAQIGITGQQVGIRPGTRDRYPLLGRHPDQARLWVCNGFGARGALTIPWYTGCLARHLTDGSPLPAEADIRRFA